MSLNKLRIKCRHLLHDVQKRLFLLPKLVAKLQYINCEDLNKITLIEPIMTNFPLLVNIPPLNLLPPNLGMCGGELDCSIIYLSML
jgi:hypothetical protein